MSLTDAKLRALKPAERQYKIADGGGLHILVAPTGSKFWKVSYRYFGKQKTLSLGGYPLVSLLDARAARDDAKRLLLAGEDPSAKKKALKAERSQSHANTFKNVTAKWLTKRSNKWVPTYKERLKARIDGDVLPYIGHLAMEHITPQDFLRIVRKIEDRGAIEMAKRVLQTCGQICRFAVAEGLIPSDPTRDLSGALATPGPVKRRKAMKPQELPTFFAKLEDDKGEPLVKLALELLVYTFVRTSEIRFAEWSEFENLGTEQALWRIPAERMKMRNEHIVPLTKRMVAIIKEVRRHCDDDRWLFPTHLTWRKKPISENAMIYTLYRLGYHGKATVHGFRGTASTVLNEHEWNRDWIELQLAHTDRDDVRSAYNTAQYLKSRREMMQWWSDYLDKQRVRGPAKRQTEDMFSDLLG